jgi:enoyl-CoA hydratase/carnithine racemase
MVATPLLLPSRAGNIGILQLNNPKKLNALTLAMVRSLNNILPQWQSDPSLKATLVLGQSAQDAQPKRPAFCAGGDVKSVYENGIISPLTQDDEDNGPRRHGWGEVGLETADFFREEYQMNYSVATQSSTRLPQISIWDGIVMGGGVGLSVHGKYRVATQNTLFAKPETSIGLFPDVGGMYWMSRLPSIGPYLALTGHRLHANDLLYSGIATHYIPSEKLPSFYSALQEATKGPYIYDSDEEEEEEENNNDAVKQQKDPTEMKGEDDCVKHILNDFHEPIDTTESHLCRNAEAIEAAFSLDHQMTVEDVIQTLRGMDGSEFASSTLEDISNSSPTSLKVTWEGLKRGRKLPDIGSVLHMEYRVSQAFMREGSDFYEGIRAKLVDKDGAPKWNPPILEEVTNDMIQSYFQPLGDEHELKLQQTNPPSSKL